MIKFIYIEDIEFGVIVIDIGEREGRVVDVKMVKVYYIWMEMWKILKMEKNIMGRYYYNILG